MNRFTWAAPLRFGNGRAIDDAEISWRLRDLEERARKAQFGEDAYLFNEAGDLCVLGDREFDARRYFGQSINCFLDLGRYDVAHAIARKMLRHYPEVLRARCTLAWIAIGRGIRPEVKRRLHEYTDAARDVGMERPLVRELGWMSDVVADRDLLVEMGEWLLDAGADREANRVFGRAFQPAPDPHVPETWAYVVEHAKRDPWLTEKRLSGEVMLPDDEPILLPLD